MKRIYSQSQLQFSIDCFTQFNFKLFVPLFYTNSFYIKFYNFTIYYNLFTMLYHFFIICRIFCFFNFIIKNYCKNNPNISTAGLLERWREEPEAPHLGKLASGELLIDLEAAGMELKHSIDKLVRESGPDQRTDWLLKKSSDTGLDPAEKQELRELLALRSTSTQVTD